MFSDPQSITIGGTTSSLPRTGSGVDTGVFTSSDGNIKVSVDHSYGRRNRRRIRIDYRKVAPDPLNAALNLNYSMSASILLDVPPVGFSPTEVKDVVKGLIGNLQASTDANTVKLVGGES